VLVEEGEGSRRLVHPDELLSSLQDIFGLLMRRRRLRRWLASKQDDIVRADGDRNEERIAILVGRGNCREADAT
jgi:hypothetical protein